jgi:hypothetical protein
MASRRTKPLRKDVRTTVTVRGVKYEAAKIGGATYIFDVFWDGVLPVGDVFVCAWEHRRMFCDRRLSRATLTARAKKILVVRSTGAL